MTTMHRNGKVSPEALEEIKQAIIALHNPGPDDVIELRAPKVNGRKSNTLSGYFDGDHLDDLARAALAIDGRVAGVYITLNPCDESLLARCANRAQEYADLTTGDKDIARRINLLIDTDPTRASGISASQEEKDAAMALLAAVREWLDLHGWPGPRVTADSGNGGHLIYAIDLPNDEASANLIERVLKAIAQQFADWDKPEDGRKRASVDASVYNAARITKLYGTMAAKGDNVPKRPHRRACILDSNPDAQPVPATLLQQVAAHLQDDTQQQRQYTNGAAGKMGMSQSESTDWVKAFCQRHNLTIAEEKTGDKGKNILRLAECPFNSDHKSPDSAITVDTNGKIGFHCFHNGCNDKTWKDVRQKFEPGYDQRTPSTNDQPPSAAQLGEPPRFRADADDDQADSERVFIQVNDMDIPHVAKQAWDALISQQQDDPALFRRGGVLVQVGTDDHGRRIVEETDYARMRGMLSRSCVFWRERKTRQGAESFIVAPPEAVVADCRVYIDPRTPVLDRVVRTPVFDPTGRLLAADGYHPTGRVVIDAQHGIPAIPDRAPTDQEVAQARALIMEDLLGDFPFVDDADKAHAVALLLLPFVRSMIDGPTPLHMIEAPTMGSGKGLLADVLTAITTGYPPAPMAEAGDDDEWRKRITSTLMSAPSHILLDNLNRTLDSGALAAALTARTWEDRLLGASANVRLPVSCVWLATANNPTLSSEIARRCVRIRIDPRIDRPWLREDFKHKNLREWVQARRGDLVAACITLIRHGLPHGTPGRTLGTFEAWSRVVGRILSGAGIPGFLDNLTKLYEAADTEGQRWRAVVEVWREAYDSQRVKAADIYRVVTEAGIDLELRGKSEKALQSAFGKALGKMKDRVIGEYQIQYAGTHKRIAEWRLMKTDGTDDLFGVGGVGGVGFDPEDTSRARTRSALRGENLHRPTPTYTTNDVQPDTDPPDDDPPEKFVPRDIPDTNAENGEGGDKRDREKRLNGDLKNSHMANSESLSRLSRLSHNTDVLEKSAEEQPHISDDTPVTQETQETSDHVFTHEKNHSRGKRDFTSPMSPMSPDTNKPAEEQPHISDDTPPRLVVVGNDAEGWYVCERDSDGELYHWFDDERRFATQAQARAAVREQEQNE